MGWKEVEKKTFFYLLSVLVRSQRAFPLRKTSYSSTLLHLFLPDLRSWNGNNCSFALSQIFVHQFNVGMQWTEHTAMWIDKIFGFKDLKCNFLFGKFLFCLPPISPTHFFPEKGRGRKKKETLNPSRRRGLSTESTTTVSLLKMGNFQSSKYMARVFSSKNNTGEKNKNKTLFATYNLPDKKVA